MQNIRHITIYKYIQDINLSNYKVCINWEHNKINEPDK